MGAPKVFRFSDVDEFRSWIRELDVDFTPFVRATSASCTVACCCAAQAATLVGSHMDKGVRRGSRGRKPTGSGAPGRMR